MILPPEAVPPRIAAVVWAVLRGARNHREIVDATDFDTVGGVHHYLHEAKEMGLVDFEPYKSNTVHPTLQVVAFTPREQR